MMHTFLFFPLSVTTLEQVILNDSTVDSVLIFSTIGAPGVFMS